MILGLLKGALTLVALGGMGAAAAHLAGRPIPVELPEPRSLPVVAGNTAGQGPDPKLIQRVLERPAFRADRRRAGVAYDGNTAGEPDTPPTPRAPRPTLALSGIVWGPEPAALIEGVPGTEGSTVLRRGDTLAGLKVTRLDSGRVVIRGMDTTWSLTVRNPWP